MAVIRDTFQSQYFIQDKEGNVWGEIKPTNIIVENHLGERPIIELEGYLNYDIDVLQAREMANHNHGSISITDDGTVLFHNLKGDVEASINPTIEVDVPHMMSWEDWEKHKEESKIKKGGNEMEILEIWKSRKVAEIYREMEEAKKEINKRDEIIERVKELEATLAEEYSMFTKITLETDSLTQESEEKLEEIERNHKTKHCKIIDKVDEIKAQLEICENYEQKMNILIAYEIIDKKTKQILA